MILCCTLESVSPVLFSYFNADSGNLQHSPTGASGQTAIERPQGIITVLLQFFSQLIGLVGWPPVYIHTSGTLFLE